MTKKKTTQGLIEALQIAMADHVADREDRRGFSRLDVLLGEVESLGAKAHSNVEHALLTIIPSVQKSDPKSWEAVRMVAAACRLESKAVAACVIKILDQLKEPLDPASRYQGFLLFREVGGTLTRPRLDKEKSMMATMRPQWVDLVLSAYVGAPENIIRFLEEEVASKQITWEDIRRRLPMLFRSLGSDFNRGIVRILRAITSLPDQEKLASAIKTSFKFDALSELERKDAATSRMSERPRTGTSLQRFRAAFDEVVPPGLIALKAMSGSVGRDML